MAHGMVNVVLFSAGLSLATALIYWRRSGRGAPAAFPLMLLAAAVWALFDALEALCPDPALKVRLSQASYLGIVAVPVLWFLFALDYGRPDLRISRGRRWLLWSVSLATLAMAATNDWHHLVWSRVSAPGPYGRALYEHGPWLWLILPYFYLLVIGGMLVLARAIVHQRDRLHRSQRIVLLAGVALPWLGNILYLSGRNPMPGVDWTPVLFAASGVLYLWGMVGWRLFDLQPVAQEVVLAHIPDGVLVFDDRRRLVSLNPAARALLGLDPDGFLTGRPAAELLRGHPALAELPADGAAPAAAFPAGAGGARRVTPTVTPLRDRFGRDVGSVLILHDITDQWRAEADARRRQADAAALAKIESLSRMAAGVAHLFNNQMQVVLGNLEATLATAPLSPRDQAALRDARQGAERAAELSRLMTLYLGQDVRHTDRIDLAAEVRRAAPALRDALPPAAGFSAEAPDAPLWIEGNADALRQLLLHLATNAGEALNAGRGRVTVRARVLLCDRAWFAGAQPHEQVPEGAYPALEVEDSGIGMSPEVRAHLFEPFFSTRFLGRGLGLAAVLGIVRYHRGVIRVQSAPGAGALFQIAFPPAPAE